jgi:DnaJ-class molecular chaperone
MKTCPDCNGDGVIEKGTDDEQQCPTCGGRGFVPDDDDGQEEVINTSSRIELARQTGGAIFNG